MTRPLDIVRTHLIKNALTSHCGAVMWDEDLPPFADGDSTVLYCRQSGSPQFGFLSTVEVEIYVFSPRNAGRAAQDATFNYARSALDYLRDDGYNVRDDSGNCILIVPRIVQDITGPSRTVTNRFYYTFTVQALHEN